MIESEKLYITLIEEKDMADVLEVYNSNVKFLQAHMDRDEVDPQWLKEELETMNKAGFYSCKAIDKKTGKIIGILDFSMKEECYLSIIMIHDGYKYNGYGKEIYLKLEEYVRHNNCKSIRIDVVIDYDKKVLRFWELNDFEVVESIKLSWTGKVLPAVVMKKKLID